MKTIPLFSALILLGIITYFLVQRSNRPDDTATLSEENIAPAEKVADKPSAAKPQQTPPKLYTKGKASRDGTGKFYLGREIAKVMGHPAINWLERGNREDEESPSLALQLMDLQPDEVIADIGAGSGYYSFRLAKLIPEGQVIAVDIQAEMIDYLNQQKQSQGVMNVTAHQSEIDHTCLDPESIDSALMVDAYHEFSHPHEMLRSLHEALRPGGRIILLEYRAEDPTVPIKPLHKMTEAQVKRELAASGFTWENTYHDLPWQHLMIFRKRENP